MPFNFYLTGACPVAPPDGTGALPAKTFENDSAAYLIWSPFFRYINEL
jgi:hypothetical protein